MHAEKAIMNKNLSPEEVLRKSSTIFSLSREKIMSMGKTGKPSQYQSTTLKKPISLTSRKSISIYDTKTNFRVNSKRKGESPPLINKQ